MKNGKMGMMAGFSAFFLTAMTGAGYAAGKEARYIPDMEAEYAGMTLWQMIRAGGGVMVVLAILSIAAVSLVVYYFLSIRREKLLPEDFFAKISSLLENGRNNEARTIAETGDNILSKVFYAGISRTAKGPVIVKEAMEEEGKRQVNGIWQRLSYLADIAAIAPMVGLLGTVLGMMQAFNVIAFQAGAVKPVLLASGISKAMVTTAAGLMIAIPSMLFYSYFKGVVQTMAARLENLSTELYHLIITGKAGQGGNK